MKNQTISVFFVVLGLIIANIGCKNQMSPASADPNDLLSAKLQQDKVDAIAIIGDSQSTGVYGSRLAELIRTESKQKLFYFGSASSARIDSWVNGNFAPIPAGAYFGCESLNSGRSCNPVNQPSKVTSSISKILALNPTVDLFVITLGDNHFFDQNSVTTALPKLISPILNSGAQCVFVTPTVGAGQFANKSKLITNLKLANDAVKRSMGRSCALIDSYTVGKDVLKSQSDLQLMLSSVSADPMKLHPRGAGAKLWAERVYQALKNLGLVQAL